MPAKSRVTRVAAYGLVLRRQQILLCRISPLLPHDAGTWTLPGGGVEFGEDPAEAMVREVGEETGLVVGACAVAGIDSFCDEEEERILHGIRIIYRTVVRGGELAYEVGGTTDLCAWWTEREARGLPLVDLAETGLALAFPDR